MGIVIYEEDKNDKEKIRNLIGECFDLHKISAQIVTFDSDIEFLKACNLLVEDSGLSSKENENLDVILKNSHLEDSAIYFKFSGKDILLHLNELEYVESCKHRLFFICREILRLVKCMENWIL